MYSAEMNSVREQNDAHKSSKVVVSLALHDMTCNAMRTAQRSPAQLSTVKFHVLCSMSHNTRCIPPFIINQPPVTILPSGFKGCPNSAPHCQAQGTKSLSGDGSFDGFPPQFDGKGTGLCVSYCYRYSRWGPVMGPG